MTTPRVAHDAAHVHHRGHVLEPGGTYASTCSGAVDSNYTISYVAGAVVGRERGARSSAPRRAR